MEFACQGFKLPAFQRIMDFPYGLYWCAHFPKLSNFFSSLKMFCSGETTKGRPAFLSSLLVAGFWGCLAQCQGLSWKESHWHSCCGCCCCSVMLQQILQTPLLLKPLSSEDTHSWAVSWHSSRVREETVCLLWVQWYFLFINASPGAEHQNEFLRMKRAVTTVLCFRRYFKCL